MITLDLDEDRGRTAERSEEFWQRVYHRSGHPKLERRLEVGALRGHVGEGEGESSSMLILT